jgi:hypothetical protein
MPAIFSLQNTLMDKYKDIEEANGIYVPKLPASMDDRKVQFRLKDLFWRFTEEICEAGEELKLNPEVFKIPNLTNIWDTSAPIRHFFEEIIDGLHFLVEASITANLNSLDIQVSLNHIKQDANGLIWMNIGRPTALLMQYSNLAFQIIQELGLAANCLKNKPWKCTEVPTDVSKFQTHMYRAWLKFFDLWESLGCSPKMLYMVYAKKCSVNNWRISTSY